MIKESLHIYKANTLSNYINLLCQYIIKTRNMLTKAFTNNIIRKVIFFSSLRQNASSMKSPRHSKFIPHNHIKNPSETLLNV